MDENFDQLNVVGFKSSQDEAEEIDWAKFEQEVIDYIVDEICWADMNVVEV
jgi:hypothetical protein